MQTLWQDLRYGVRMLLKQPGFTLIAVLTLALGIGANTTIFSIVKGVLLRPLPYAEPQQLVRLFESMNRAALASDRMEVAPANFLDWRAQTQPFSGLAEQYPQTNRNWSVNVVPLLEEQVGAVRPALLALLGAIALVLLIALINAANLLLARAVGRQATIGIRLALGAGRGCIVRQLLTESLRLAVLGGVAGLWLGRWALDALMALAPENLPRLGEVRKYC